MNPYEVLGVKKNASPATITKAFRRRALAVHPDRNPGDAQAGSAMQQVQLAYDVLSDEHRRQLYDTTGEIGEGVDNAEAMVLDVVSQAFTALVLDLIGAPLEPGDAFDPLAAMAVKVAELEARLAEERSKMERAAEVIQAMSGRFAIDGANRLQELIDAELGKIGVFLASKDQELARVKAAAELLDQYSYRPGPLALPSRRKKKCSQAMA